MEQFARIREDVAGLKASIDKISPAVERASQVIAGNGLPGHQEIARRVIAHELMHSEKSKIGFAAVVKAGAAVVVVVIQVWLGMLVTQGKIQRDDAQQAIDDVKRQITTLTTIINEDGQ